MFFNLLKTQSKNMICINNPNHIYYKGLIDRDNELHFIKISFGFDFPVYFCFNRYGGAKIKKFLFLSPLKKNAYSSFLYKKKRPFLNLKNRSALTYREDHNNSFLNYKILNKNIYKYVIKLCRFYQYIYMHFKPYKIYHAVYFYSKFQAIQLFYNTRIDSRQNVNDHFFFTQKMLKPYYRFRFFFKKRRRLYTLRYKTATTSVSTIQSYIKLHFTAFAVSTYATDKKVSIY